MRTPSPPQRPSSPTRAAIVLLGALAAGSLCAGACRREVETRAIAATPAPAAAPSPPAPAQAGDAGYDLRPAEKAAVDGFLKAHPDLRAATDFDHRRPDDGDGIDGLYGIYHPYFVRGDDNDDGVLDFILAFVRRDSAKDTPWFSVVVFEGKPDGTFEPGAFLERDISLADGDLSVDRDSIVVTPDVSDDANRRYRWDPARQRHVFVRDDASEEPASPPASQI